LFQKQGGERGVGCTRAAREGFAVRALHEVEVCNFMTWHTRSGHSQFPHGDTSVGSRVEGPEPYSFLLGCSSLLSSPLLSSPSLSTSPPRCGQNLYSRPVWCTGRRSMRWWAWSTVSQDGGRDAASVPACPARTPGAAGHSLARFIVVHSLACCVSRRVGFLCPLRKKCPTFGILPTGDSTTVPASAARR